MKSSRASSSHIIVAGYIVKGPLGGLVWHHLQYLLCLQQLGYDILFAEDSLDYPACYQPETFQFNSDPGYGIAFLQNIFGRYGLQNNWAYFDYHTNQWKGKSRQEVENFANKAAIYINLSGADPLREIFHKIPIRIFIDTDPVFTQINHLTDEEAMKTAKKHNRFFSFGENFGKPECLIPNDGFDWKPARQPVYLDAWKISEPKENGKWTTVMQWDSYKERSYKGKIFGMKSLSFSAFENLPAILPGEKFELASGSDTTPVEKLKQKGWNVISSLIPTNTPETYQDYLEQSKGEWSVAKHGYVISNCGWFSERSACYLASGKPVLVQDTGFSKIFETGKGLCSFSTAKDIIHRMEDINSNYKKHCTWAREMVKEYFDGAKVLQLLLESI